MPNCTCFEPSTSKHVCPACGDRYTIVKAVSKDNEPRQDRETVIDPEAYMIPEIFRKFLRLYKKPEKNPEENTQ